MTMVFQVQDAGRSWTSSNPATRFDSAPGKSNGGAYMASDIQPATP